MQKFIAKYQSQIAGVLSGFDRLVFRGSLRKISYVFGLLGTPEVMRFLGKKLTQKGQVHGRLTAEIVSDCRRRQEGVRIKHRYNYNSVKLYDKAYTPQGSVLRAEMTIDNPEDFTVYRRVEGHPQGALAWQRMRKGVADLYRRAQVSQKVNALSGCPGPNR